MRENIARSLGVSIDNDFELLARLGGECAGALWIGNDQPDFPNEQVYVSIQHDDLYQMITDGNVFSSVLGKSKARLSLAGAQDKLPIRLIAIVDFHQNGYGVLFWIWQKLCQLFSARNYTS